MPWALLPISSLPSAARADPAGIPAAQGPRPCIIPGPSPLPPDPGVARAVAPVAPAVSLPRAPAPPGDPGTRLPSRGHRRGPSYRDQQRQASGHSEPGSDGPAVQPPHWPESRVLPRRPPARAVSQAATSAPGRVCAGVWAAGSDVT